MKVTLDEQLAELGRELALRRNVYPMFVAKGRMEQSEADLHMMRLEAAIKTLTWLKENRAAIVEGAFA